MITLTENNEIILDKLKVAQAFNDYFVNVLVALKINFNKDFLTINGNLEDLIQAKKEKSKNHSSILEINNNNPKKQ